METQGSLYRLGGENESVAMQVEPPPDTPSEPDEGLSVALVRSQSSLCIDRRFRFGSHFAPNLQSSSRLLHPSPRRVSPRPYVVPETLSFPSENLSDSSSCSSTQSRSPRVSSPKKHQIPARSTKKREHWDEEEESQTTTKKLRSNPLSRSCPQLYPELADHQRPLPCKTGYECHLVEPEIVRRLLDGEIANDFEFHIIDCRFDYEYDGGHIRSATNIPLPNAILEMFFNDEQPLVLNKRVIIIFHCEFSSKRAPETLKVLRKYDRQRNLENWPNLYYPELYLLEGYTKMSDNDLCKIRYMERRNSQDLLEEELGLNVERPHRRPSQRESSLSPGRRGSPKFLQRLMEEETQEAVPTMKVENSEGEYPSSLPSFSFGDPNSSSI